MTSSVSRGLAVGITLTLGLSLLAGCSGHAPGNLGRLQQLLETCPRDQQITSYVTTDGTGTSQSDAITAERLKSIETVVERTAVCAGHLMVTAFGTNSVTVPIYDADIVIPGATDNARLRRVPDVVEQVMDEVDAAYGPAIAALPAGGTDVTGLYRLFAEAQTLRPDMRLEVTALTDGLTNQGTVIDRALSPEETTALADQVSMPELPGASISVIGIGRVAGDPLSSDFIDGMKAFYTRLCENTGADQCLVVTDGR